jgi:hypothetical protein
MHFPLPLPGGSGALLIDNLAIKIEVGDLNNSIFLPTRTLVHSDILSFSPMRAFVPTQTQLQQAIPRTQSSGTCTAQGRGAKSSVSKTL